MESLESQRRYLSPIESTACDRMLEIVQEKEDLDRQFALQWALKHWLFIHIPFTVGLLGFALLHTTIVLTIISGNSPYDRYEAGDETALNEAQKRGICIKC